MIAPTTPLAAHESSLAVLGGAWAEDEALRARAGRDPRGVLSEYGMEVADDVDARIVANTAETFHLPMPPDPNARLDDSALTGVVGSGSCASSAATASTISTVPSCFGCTGTLSSAGSATN